MNIQSQNLVIREIERRDAPDILDAMECPQVSDMHCNGLGDIDKVNSYVDVILNEYKNGKYRTFAVADTSTGKMIGSITLDITPQFARTEYSYWVNMKYRNHGYATEAVKMMNEYCFNSLSMNRVQVLTSNPVSEKVIMKAGFTYEGTLKQYFGYDGRFWDVKMYALIASEYHK